MQDLAVVKALSLGYLIGLVSLSVASALWLWLRPRLAPQQRADAGFNLIVGTFALSALLAVIIYVGVVREIIYMSTRYFHCLMHGGWGNTITGTGAAVLTLSLLLGVFGWLRGRTPRLAGGATQLISGLTVVDNEGISTAGLIGCWRPQVWVNPTYWNSLSADERELALAHERWHLRRRDNLRKLVLQLIAGLYAVLPMSRRWLAHYELDCELAVDHHCRAANGPAYVELIAASAKFALGNRAVVASGMSQADLRQRLAHLTAAPLPSRRRAVVWTAALAVLAILPVAGLLTHSVTRCLLACYLGY
jgi:hypothetical protein